MKTSFCKLLKSKKFIISSACIVGIVAILALLVVFSAEFGMISKDNGAHASDTPPKLSKEEKKYHLVITEQADFDEHIEDGVFGFKDNYTMVTLWGNIVIDDIVIEKPVKITLDKKVKLNGSISFASDLAGNYELINKTYDFLHEKVKYNIPNGNAIYTGLDIYANTEIKDNVVALTYNGKDVNSSVEKTNLPIIHINTSTGTPVSDKENYVDAKVSVNYNGYNYENIDNAVAQVRGRGHSSWELRKKPMKIKFETETSLFGLPEAKKWVLQANMVDRSLIRNTLAMRISSHLDNMIFIPHSIPIDVYVNGRYQGVYTLSEPIEVNKGRIEAEKDSSIIATDYLIEIGGDAKEMTFAKTNAFKTTLYSYVTVNSPDEKTLTTDQYNYIGVYMDKIDKAVMNNTNYEELIDIPSLIDFFIIHELSYNVDSTFRRSDFLVKFNNDKMYMACPWDYDYAFGNMAHDTDNYEEWIVYGNEKTDAFNEYIKDNWMRYLLTYPEFTEQLKNRWNEVKEDIYNEAMYTIDYYETMVAPSAELNFKIWKIMGNKLQFEDKRAVRILDYAGQMKYLRNFIDIRYAWMDKTINEM